jgi:hypothetical protein
VLLNELAAGFCLIAHQLVYLLDSDAKEQESADKAADFDYFGR